MDRFDIYLIGVGGQGIGLLSEIILRAADHAGHPVKGVDTHGLAQRGGIVRSQVRIGSRANSPLIRQGAADLVVALERHEALRGMNSALRDAGTLLYYNTVWQPLAVRLNQAPAVSEEMIAEECNRRTIRGDCRFQGRINGRAAAKHGASGSYRSVEIDPGCPHGSLSPGHGGSHGRGHAGKKPGDF